MSDSYRTPAELAELDEIVAEISRERVAAPGTAGTTPLREEPSMADDCCRCCSEISELPVPLHRTETTTPWGSCSTCDGGGCHDCTEPA